MWTSRVKHRRHEICQPQGAFCERSLKLNGLGGRKGEASPAETMTHYRLSADLNPFIIQMQKEVQVEKVLHNSSVASILLLSEQTNDF